MGYEQLGAATLDWVRIVPFHKEERPLVIPQWSRGSRRYCIHWKWASLGFERVCTFAQSGACYFQVVATRQGRQQLLKNITAAIGSHEVPGHWWVLLLLLDTSLTYWCLNPLLEAAADIRWFFVCLVKLFVNEHEIIDCDVQQVWALQRTQNGGIQKGCELV